MATDLERHVETYFDLVNELYDAYLREEEIRGQEIGYRIHDFILKHKGILEYVVDKYSNVDQDAHIEFGYCYAFNTLLSRPDANDDGIIYFDA